MKTTYSITLAQRNFPGLVKETASGEAVAITRHDETVAYVVSAEQMEAMVETMEVLADENAMRSIRDYERGGMRMISLDEIGDDPD